MANILILFHSTSGLTWRMAQAVAAGADAVDGCTAVLKQVPEIAGIEKILGPNGAAGRAAFAEIPEVQVEDLRTCDGVAIGTPVYFGNMSPAMNYFLSQTGKEWMEGALTGKPATVFVGAGSGGGCETAITALWSLLASHGMTIVTLGSRAPELTDLAEAHGGSPLGAGSVGGGPGERPSTAEKAMAVAQGRALAETALALAAG